MSKKYAHKVVNSEDLSFKKRKDKQPEKPIVSGDLILRIIDLPKGTILKNHGHTKRMDKFLLKGRLVYEEDQEILPGSYAKLKPWKPYEVEAKEDSHLLLVERAGTQMVREGERNRGLSSVVDWWYKRKKELSNFKKDYAAPVSIFSILLISSLYLLYFYWPSAPSEIHSLYTSVAVNLIAASIFLLIVSWAKNSYINASAKLFGAFDLENFCENIKHAKSIVRIYSTYSNLFLYEELLELFTSVVAHRFNQEDSFHVEILILDPFSYAIKQRNDERPENIASLTAKNVVNLYEWLYGTSDEINPHSKIIEVKISNSLPRHQHHQIDSEINFSFYPRDYPASESQYIRCKDRTSLGQFAEHSFKNVWTDHAYTRDLKDFYDTNKNELKALVAGEYHLL